MRIFAVWLVVGAMACGDDGGDGAPDGGYIVESMDGGVLDSDTPDPGMDMALDAGDQDAGPEPGADAESEEAKGEAGKPGAEAPEAIEDNEPDKLEALSDMQRKLDQLLTVIDTTRGRLRRRHRGVAG